MHHLSRGAASVLASACVCACAAAISRAPGAQATGVANPTSSCSIAKVWHSLGPTYVEVLSVSGTSCASAETLVQAYNGCRLKAGGVSGRCTARVDGFRCRERRQSSPIQFTALVMCARSRQAVDFSYSEDT